MAKFFNHDLDGTFLGLFLNQVLKLEDLICVCVYIYIYIYMYI